MKEHIKYEGMTEYNFLELVHIAVSTVLEDVRKGRVIEDIPKLTEEQLDELSYEISFNEHRIKFYPEENRTVSIRVRAEEYQYEGEDE